MSQQWGALYGELSSTGALVSGTGLESEEAATTLRTRDGEPLITDGPFAETKEMLFSFFVLNADDLDAALAWAKKMPCAKHGSVEVRPLSIHSHVRPRHCAGRQTARPFASRSDQTLLDLGAREASPVGRCHSQGLAGGHPLLCQVAPRDLAPLVTAELDVDVSPAGRP